MQKYLDQLHERLEEITLLQWQTAPPHFYGLDVANPYLKAPKGWKPGEAPDADPIRTDVMMEEMENWLKGKEDGAMIDGFGGLYPEEFPPPSRLTEEQAERLVFQIFRLWSAYNFLVSRPQKASALKLYELVVQRMLEPAMFMKHGGSGIEFCNYNSDDCPFGEEHCSCLD